jgi:hypothetical protein
MAGWNWGNHHLFLVGSALQVREINPEDLITTIMINQLLVPFGNQTWQWKSPIREVLLWEKRL